MKRKISIILILPLILLVSCMPVSRVVETPTGLPQILQTETPVPTLTVLTPTPVPSIFSPAEQAAMRSLSSQVNIPIDKIQLISSQTITWNDGCLGVVIPGVLCTQGLVPGYRILLAANGLQYEYHTNLDGSSVIAFTEQLALVKFVVYNLNNTIQLVDPNIPLGSTYNPFFTGFLPSGGSINGTAYVLDMSNGTKGVSVSPQGVKELGFMQSPTYGLAIWHGDQNSQPMLAWGTQLIFDPSLPSSLQISAPDGSKFETLLTLPDGQNPPLQIVAEFWSEDGKSLYFSKEPVGIGGYIPFGGSSDLYKIDVATRQVSELIPLDPKLMVATCFDAISGDYRFTADHCTPNAITVREIGTGKITTIQAPPEAVGYSLMGSARFNRDGSRLAFALAMGNPDSEQGWVALSDSISGASKVIMTANAGSYLTVLGWLDDKTILVQSNPMTCYPNCDRQLWMVGIDGSAPQIIADGTFITIIDNK